MAVLLSKGALALFAFTAFASATGPLASSASDIESERKLRLRGQEVKDSIKVDSFRRLGSSVFVEGCPGNLKMFEVQTGDVPLVHIKVFDLCLPHPPEQVHGETMFEGLFGPYNDFKSTASQKGIMRSI